MVFLYLLRPHLAAVVVIAEILVWVWEWFSEKRRVGAFEAPVLIAIGVIAGDYLYSWAFQRRTMGVTPPFWDWGISEVTRIASNFVGLQFLTNDESKLRLSVSELLFLRIFLSETVIIPAGATILILFFGHHLHTRYKFVLLSFSLYVSIATNTDFNSFRQNIPFMPLLGLVIVQLLRSRSISRTQEVKSEDFSVVLTSTNAPRET